MPDYDPELYTGVPGSPPGMGLPPVRAGFEERGRTEEGGSGSVLGRVKERAQQWASGVADTAGDAWRSTRDEARELASRASERAGEAVEAAADFIRRHPYPCLFATLGVGFLLGQALRSARESRRRW